MREITAGPSSPLRSRSPLFEIALVLLRLDHLVSSIVNTNHGIM